MTHSPATREEDAERVLRAMLAEAGDRMLLQQHLTQDSPALVGALPTTLYWLEEHGMIQALRHSGGADYRLTPAGWLAALELAGELTSEGLRERCTRLVRTLKAAVKEHNRSAVTLAWPDVVAADAVIPIGWLYNALDSGLLERVFDKHEMNAWHDSRGRIIRIPPTFGMPR